jgi:HEAT repeat protein
LGTLDTDDDPGLAAVVSRMKRAVRAEGSATEDGDAAAVRELFPIDDESDEGADGAGEAFSNQTTSATSDKPVTPPAAPRPQEVVSGTADGSRAAESLRGRTAGDLTARDSDPLVAALSDADSDLRYEAITALRDRLSPKLRDAFLKATGDSDNYVRRVAIDAIGELDSHRGRG